MKGFFKVFCFTFFMASFLLVTAISWAQSGGTLKGKAIDENEKFPLPTVQIWIVGTKLYGSTGSDGTFVIDNIPPGVYKVTFELAGYLIETVKNVNITAGQTTELNVSMRMGFAHEVTVTARRDPTILQRIPQNIEVVTSEELEDTPIINVVQVLNNVTGVDVGTGSGNTTLGNFFFIDGYGDDYIRKMVDGVDIGEVVSNWSMLNAYPQELIDQVEVIKGGTSSVWGSNMGGITNVITKRLRNMERPMITLKGTFSSFGEMDFGEANAVPNSGNLQGYSANIMGTLKNFYYIFGYNHNKHDGFVDYATEKNYSIFTKLGYDFSDNTYLDFLYSFNKVWTKAHEFLKTDMFGPFFPYFWHDKLDSEGTSQVASLKFSSFVTDAFNVEAQLKFNRTTYDGTREYLEGGALTQPPGYMHIFDFSDQKLGFTVKGSYRPSENFSLVGGMDYYRIKADFAYIPDQPIIYVDSVAPFINSEYRIGNLSLHAGARYDYDSSFGDQVSPSVGLNYNFTRATLVRLNVARTFKVPALLYTLGEAYVVGILPNPDLKPERAWAYSAGFESQELHYVWVKVSVYYHKMTDGIVQVPHETPGRFTWANTDEFTRKGYEAELGFLTGFGVTGYIGTNYNDHVNTTEDVVIDWIPTRTYKAGLKYKNNKLDLLINLRGRYIWWNEGDFYSYLFDPHDKKWLFDMRISKGFKITENTRLRIFVDIFNLTDQLYWDRSDQPNPRRWAALGFELQFK
ncbi:MAG: TonB-dependent receptor domain-containing protein [Candidatus Aminicenantia bacterium]